MPIFAYTIQESGGRRREGTIEAASEQAAAGILRGEGALILALRVHTGKPAGQQASEKPSALAALTIRKQDIEQTLRQLGTLLRAGVPILTALGSMSETAPGGLKTALRRTAADIRDGRSFSKALAANLPGCGRVTVGLLSVGEANGTLDRMAVHAADLMERSRKTVAQIRQAFTYPAIVTLAGLGVGYYMVQHVFPTVMDFIAQGRQAAVLPLPTRMVIWLNDFLTAYGIYFLIGPVALTVGIIVLRRASEPSREAIDALALRIPLLGGAFRFHANALWCLLLGSMLRSGLDVLSAVELTAGAMGNGHYAVQFRQIRGRLRDGASLSAAMGDSALRKRCPMAHTMVAVSEQGGSLDEGLLHVAAFAEDQLERRVTLLGKLVEPAVFIVIGGFVGIVYFGFFMAVMAATRAAI